MGGWEVVEEVVCSGGQRFDSGYKWEYVTLKNRIERGGAEKDTREGEIERGKNNNQSTTQTEFSKKKSRCKIIKSKR